MSDSRTPAKPARNITDVNNVVNYLQFHANLHHQSSLIPKYDFNQSVMKSDYKNLQTLLQTANNVPDSIKDQVNNLDQLFKDTQAALLKGGNTNQLQANWDKGFQGLKQQIQTEITSAKAAEPGRAEATKGLDELADKLKEIQEGSLQQESQQMEEKLREQKRRAMDEVRLNITALNKYNGDLEKAITNRWVNINIPNNDPQNANDSEVNLSNKAVDSPVKDYGTLEQADSKIIVRYEKKNGSDVYTARFQGTPEEDSVFNMMRPIIQVATTIIGLTMTPAIAVLELCSCLLAGAGYILSAGKITPPHAYPGSFLTSQATKDLFAPETATARQLIKAEISAAQDYAHKTEMTLHNTGGGELRGEQVDRMVIMLQEMQRKAGYTPGKNGNPGAINNPKDAMGLRLSTELETFLTLIEGQKNILSKEANQILKEMYKARTGSDKGYSSAQFKTNIQKEFTAYSLAIENQKNITNSQKYTGETANDKPADPSNTSTITKGKEAAPMPHTAGELSANKGAESPAAKQGEPSPKEGEKRPSAEGTLAVGTLKKETFVPDPVNDQPPPSSPEGTIRRGI